MVYNDSLDANVILRFIVNDVPAQRQRVIKLLAQPRAVHHLTDIALLEAVYALETSYHCSRRDIIDRLTFFLAHYDNIIAYNRPLTNLVFPFYLDHPKLSFADCCLATLAELNHAEPLFTFDQKLAAQHPSAKLLK